MKYRVLCVGRRAQDPLLEAAAAYAERIAHYAPIAIVQIRDATAREERDALLARLRPRDHVVALDEHGKQLSTVELAQRVAGWQQRGLEVTLLLGGADGLHPDLLARAAEVLSLSRLTLPHRLAEVVLLEQLYRAHTILRGEPYHRA